MAEYASQSTIFPVTIRGITQNVTLTYSSTYTGQTPGTEDQYRLVVQPCGIMDLPEFQAYMRATDSPIRNWITDRILESREQFGIQGVPDQQLARQIADTQALNVINFAEKCAVFGDLSGFTSVTAILDQDGQGSVVLDRADGSTVNMLFDNNDTQPWSMQTTSTDAQGRAESIETVNDNGTRTVIINAFDGTEIYSSVTKYYDAQGHLLSQSFNNDNGTTTTVTYDADGTHAWATDTRVSDAAGNLMSETLVNDNGSQAITINDVDNIGARWSESYFYDPTGHLASQDIVNDDGTSSVTVNDVTGTQPWSSQVNVYDSFGNLTTQTVNNDDGTHAVYGFDPTNQYTWSSYVALYNGQGARTGEIRHA
jgi:YD repeat-containing protein